jgi:hypothetical protein
MRWHRVFKNLSQPKCQAKSAENLHASPFKRTLYIYTSFSSAKSILLDSSFSVKTFILIYLTFLVDYEPCFQSFRSLFLFLLFNKVFILQCTLADTL